MSSFGGFSGGTAASAVDMNTARSPSEKAAMSDPYCLTPDHLTCPLVTLFAHGRMSVFRWLSGKTFPGLKYSREAEGWMVPTTFAQVNVPVVMRSNALAKEPYGKDFVYQEGLRTPNLPLALLAQFFVTLFDVVLEYSFLQRTHAIPVGDDISRRLSCRSLSQGGSKSRQRTGTQRTEAVRLLASAFRWLP